jgi:positive regulator of sigma E activity
VKGCMNVYGVPQEGMGVGLGGQDWCGCCQSRQICGANVHVARAGYATSRQVVKPIDWCGATAEVARQSAVSAG